MNPVGGFGHNRQEDEVCPCKDPMNPDGDTCYQPICPAGYYKCCATCSMSTCVGYVKMEYSKRGIAECIPCPAGFFCKGCDIFEQCPVYTPPPGPKGEPEPKLGVSKFGSKEVEDCITCSETEDANLEKDRCIELYYDVCNVKLVKRCYNSCLSSDGTKNLTPCEKVKCTMFCAKAWNDECVDALSRTCRTLTNPPPEKAGDPADLFDKSMYVYDCDVNCDGASSLSLTALLASLAVAMLLQSLVMG